MSLTLFGSPLTPHSEVFRHMTETGSGVKQIQIDETAATIELFLEFVSTGKVTFITKGEPICYDRPLNLVRFVNKLDCEVTLQHLKNFAHVSVTGKDNNYMRMLLAMHLNLPRVVAELIQDRPGMFNWLHPIDHRRPVDRLMSQLSFDIFQRIPYQYLWALNAAGLHLHDQRDPDYVHDRAPAERFLWFMRECLFIE